MRKRLNISHQTIKVLISMGDVETLDLLKDIQIHEVLKKIAFTRPLSAEEILIRHGKDAVIAYMNICNEYDSHKISEELTDYLIKIK